ncbi:MAG: hypothetical protein M0Q13_14845, partial [Methanothrix sp.]|nr:hypothetical protein [Methanothrix sp.]
PQKIVFTEDDLYNADTFSFGSIIGSITNKSSNGYALLPNIEKQFGNDSEEYKITLSRLKQCCKAQSAQIDKAKIGKEVKGIPKLWIHKQKINKDESGNVLDSDEVVKEINKYNNILLNKYPYFFKYLYKDAKRKYNKYCEENEMTCHQKFQMSFKKLKDLARHSQEQEQFIKNFYTYSPLTHSDSPMNLLCKYIEGINFQINDKVKNTTDFDMTLYKSSNYNYTKEQYAEIIRVLKTHISSIKFDRLLPKDEDDDTHFDVDVVKEYKVDNDTLEKNINEVCSNVYVVTNCLIDYFYIDKPSANKDVLWSIYGKYIFNNVKENTFATPKFPFPNKDGDIIYWNKQYLLKEIIV